MERTYEAERQLTQAREKVAQMEDSLSWRVTRPLRRFMSMGTGADGHERHRGGQSSGRTAAAGAHFVHVTRALTTTEFKLRYFGSVLGYLWTLLRPLMLFGVLYVVFTHVVRFGGNVPHYPVVLLAGDRRLQLLLGGDQRRPRQPRRAREPAAQGLLPARRGADLGLAHGRRQPRRSGSWCVRASRSSTASTPTACGSASWLACCSWSRSRPRHRCCCRCCSCATATCSRSGRSRSSCCSGARRSSTRSSRVPDSLRELLMLNPLAVAIQQGRHWLVPVEHRERRRRRSGAAVPAADPAGDLRAVVVLAWWVFRRAEGGWPRTSGALGLTLCVLSRPSARCARPSVCMREVHDAARVTPPPDTRRPRSPRASRRSLGVLVRDRGRGRVLAVRRTGARTERCRRPRRPASKLPVSTPSNIVLVTKTALPFLVLERHAEDRVLHRLANRTRARNAIAPRPARRPPAGPARVLEPRVDDLGGAVAPAARGLRRARRSRWASSRSCCR